MSEFKIAPVTQCEPKGKLRFLSWFLLTILAIDIGISGYAFFRLLTRVENLERQLHCLIIEKGEEPCTAQNF